MALANVFWRAVYNDGAHLDEYNLDGTKNKYTDINRTILKQFIIFRNGIPHVILNLDANKRLIYRSRAAWIPQTREKDIVYFAGWQEKVNGKNVQMIVFLFRDGHVEILDRFDENHEWFYPCTFLKEEEI